MKYSLVFLLLLLVKNSNAQFELSTPEVVARKFLETLTTSDTTVTRKLIFQTLDLKTIVTKPNGETDLFTESLTEFLAAIGTMHSEKWEEKSNNYITYHDAGLAIVCCDYEFFVDGRFLHRGMDVFQLIKTPEGWKIFGITDTRYLSEE